MSREIGPVGATGAGAMEKWHRASPDRCPAATICVEDASSTCITPIRIELGEVMPALQTDAVCETVVHLIVHKQDARLEGQLG